ncbi:hypothetical protein ACIRF8_12645 [Streptomyces sp. NPDC102406]|uniref:hypothetical protein n=1 Tax=Streptomyces sp. NPDC102406 TaxID=3366171 RepID=UPI00382E9B80
MRQNATRTDIIAMLRDGHSNLRIARELHCDKGRVARIRRELDLPDYVPAVQTRTAEEKWHSLTRSTDGGHVEWLGERATASGTPVMRHKEQSYSPAAIAFRIRTGRDAEGYAIADCGKQHCVAPDHVEDEAGRRRNREQLRYLTGGQIRKPRCVHGHDQAEHGRYEADGRAYCEQCKVIRKRGERQAVPS